MDAEGRAVMRPGLPAVPRFLLTLRPGQSSSSVIFVAAVVIVVAAAVIVVVAAVIVVAAAVIVVVAAVIVVVAAVIVVVAAVIVVVVVVIVVAAAVAAAVGAGAQGVAVGEVLRNALLVHPDGLGVLAVRLVAQHDLLLVLIVVWLPVVVLPIVVLAVMTVFVVLAAAVRDRDSAESAGADEQENGHAHGGRKPEGRARDPNAPSGLARLANLRCERLDEVGARLGSICSELALEIQVVPVPLPDLPHAVRPPGRVLCLPHIPVNAPRSLQPLTSANP